MLTPQRTLAAPFTDALRGPAAPAGGEVTVLTLGGLAQRMVELFWPVVAAEAGFAQPDRPPTFLTLETAQYFMARLVGPLLAEGYFDSISIDRNRLYSQILDNLNKAAAVGFPHSEIGARLTAAWVGDSVQTRVYAEAQECADRFRAYCLAHNLLDFSLQYELFAQRLWPLPACRDYLTRRYTHLIVDNVEEDTPVAHDLLAAWLPTCASALVIYDWEAGYRRFLGADSRGAYRLKTLCNEHVTLTDSFVTSPEVHALEGRLARALGAKRGAEPVAVVMGRGRARIDASEMSFDAQPAEPAAPALPPDAAGVRPALDFTSHRYHPEMLDWVADEIAGLVHGRGLRPAADRRAGAVPGQRAALRAGQPADRARRPGALPSPVPLAARGAGHRLPADAGRAGAPGVGRAAQQVRRGLRAHPGHRRDGSRARPTADRGGLPRARRRADPGILRRHRAGHAGTDHLSAGRAL